MSKELELLESENFECIKCGASFKGFEALCTHIDECLEKREIDEIEESKKYNELEDEMKRAESYISDRSDW